MPDGPIQRRGILLERLVGSRQWDRALRTAEEWLAEDPACLRAHRAAGLSLVNLRRYPAALPHLEKVLAGNPQDAFAHRLACIAFLQQGSRDRANDHIKQALRLRPDDPGNWRQVAWMCYGVRAYALATTHARRALELAPKDAATINLLAMCVRSDPQKQLAHYQHALALEPENSFVHYNLGVHYLEKKGDHRQAAEAFRVALSYDPTNVSTQQKLEVAQGGLVTELLENDGLYRLLRWPGLIFRNEIMLMIVLPTIFGIIMSGAHMISQIRPFVLWLVLGLPVFFWPLFRGYEALLTRDILEREGVFRGRGGGPLGCWRWANWQRLAVFFSANFVCWASVLWFLAAVQGTLVLIPFFAFLVLVTWLHTAQAAWRTIGQRPPALQEEPASAENSSL